MRTVAQMEPVREEQDCDADDKDYWAEEKLAAAPRPKENLREVCGAVERKNVATAGAMAITHK